MKRGVVGLTNPELKVLHDLVATQKDVSDKKKLLIKLAPSESAQNYDVFISGDEAEIILDSISAPSEDDDLNLVSARIKIQQFLVNSRFG